VNFNPKVRLNVWHTALVLIAIASATNLYAQREREIPSAQESQSQYSRRFFIQLRSVFGRFRDSELQRAFDKALPIQCSELVNGDGEWRTVAFFNEKRELGDWYRGSLEEVKRDLTVFVFKGVCRNERSPVQLTTKFPVSESVDAYNNGRIALAEIDINVNAPVRATFETQSQAYTFDLPYLFLISRHDDESLYSLAPPRLLDRDRYATDVVDHWDCKSVVAENVTYQFLLCRTTTLPRNPVARNQSRGEAFGASAYFILSDGKEASSNVKLTFSDSNDEKHAVEDVSEKFTDDRVSVLEWEMPDADEKIVNLQRNDFRIGFASRLWTGRIDKAQVLSGRQLSSLESSSPSSGADSCVWLPGSPGLANRLLNADAAGEPVTYSMKARDQDGQSSTSIAFEMRSPSGAQLGTLQCFFPRTPSAASVAFSRWTAIVGTNLSLEIRP
jgi:hypothetical protein